MFPLLQKNHSLKRQRSLSLDQATDLPPVKKQCEDYYQAWTATERFWDTLPKIRLTRRALIEHNRRTAQPHSEPSSAWKIKPRRRSTRLQQSAREKQLSSLRLACDREPGPGLKRFARRGGPDLRAIRGFPEPTMSDQTSRPSRRTTASGRTTSTKRSGPYDANYELKLAQTGIFVAPQKDGNNYRIKPSNYDEIVARLNEARSSLSPSRFTEQDFEKFQEETEHEILESETMMGSMAVIEGNNKFFSRTGGQGPFNNLESFNPDLAMAVPDSYDGAQPLDFDHRVLNDLDEYIVPSTDTSRPAVPNFFLEGKSRKGRADVAKRQAAHTGAIGARGMISLQSYPSQTPQYDGNAYSFTSTFHDGQLKMYTTHATAPTMSEARPQYHMTQLKAYAMTGDRDTFVKGATHYRNARDLAKEHRDKFIRQANQRVQEQNKRSNDSWATTNTLSMSTSLPDEEYEDSPDTDTSTDDLALDISFKRSRHARSHIDGTDEDGDEGDVGQLSFTMSTPAHNRDISQRWASRPVSKPRSTKADNLNLSASHEQGRMSLAKSSAYTSPTYRASPDPLTDDIDRTSLRMSSEADNVAAVPRKASKQRDVPNLKEVRAKRAKMGGINGRVYTTRRGQVFLPDSEWQKVKKGGSDAWVNWEHEVYCLDS